MKEKKSHVYERIQNLMCNLSFGTSFRARCQFRERVHQHQLIWVIWNKSEIFLANPQNHLYLALNVCPKRQIPCWLRLLCPWLGMKGPSHTCPNLPEMLKCAPHKELLPQLCLSDLTAARGNGVEQGKGKKIILQTLQCSPNIICWDFPGTAWAALHSGLIHGESSINSALTEVTIQSLLKSDVKKKLHHDNAKRQWWTARYLLGFATKMLYSVSQKVPQLLWEGNSAFWGACVTWPALWMMPKWIIQYKEMPYSLYNLSKVRSNILWFTVSLSSEAQHKCHPSLAQRLKDLPQHRHKFMTFSIH